MALVRLPVERDGLHLIPLYEELPVAVMNVENELTLLDQVTTADLAAEHLGVVAAPRSEDDLRDTLAAYAPELRGTPAAQEAIRFLLLHPDLPAAARQGYLALASAAIGLVVGALVVAVVTGIKRLRSGSDDKATPTAH